MMMNRKWGGNAGENTYFPTSFGSAAVFKRKYENVYNK